MAARAQEKGIRLLRRCDGVGELEPFDVCTPMFSRGVNVG